MDHAQFQVVSDGTVDVVTVEGVLDLATSPRLRTLLLHCLGGGDRAGRVVVDLSGVELLDSSGVGTLVRMRSHAEQRGGSLRVVGATGMVRQVLEVTGVAASLGLRDGGEEEDPSTGEPMLTAGLLLGIMATLPPDAPERRHLRQEVIEHCLPYATSLARRFRDRGEPLDDLSQVATLGLVKAVDGYDAMHGTNFAAYATPTIIGEIRRYFRDKGWRIKVPRRLQETRLAIGRVEGELTQRLGRAPTAADYADALGVDETEVLAAVEAGRGYRPASLSAPVGPDGDGLLGDPLGSPDPGIEAVESRATLRDLLARLPPREQRILALRYFGHQTQAQIAEQVGVSQMHVSRLLAQSLGELRDALRAVD